MRSRNRSPEEVQRIKRQCATILLCIAGLVLGIFIGNVIPPLF